MTNCLGLTKKETCFSSGIKFQIPVDVYDLDISSTNITILDGILFPTGLKILKLQHNQNLIAMVNTNVQELNQLVDIMVSFHTKLSKIDKFNKNFRVESSTVSSGAVVVGKDS